MLSALAERVTFVMIPPLFLIFLVLGTIFIGVATPTEDGAMGAVGAIIMALIRRRLTLELLKLAMDTTTGCRARGVVHPGGLDGVRADLPRGSTAICGSSTCRSGCRASGVPDRGQRADLRAGVLLDFFELAFIIVPLLARWPTRWAST